MTLMPWDEKKFDVHVPKMNAQHHGLVDVMNKLYDRAAAKAPKAELSKLITELKQRTVQHFRDEEALLASVNYPQLESHKSIHAQLLEDFGKHSNAFETGPGVVAAEFFNFLKLWLTAHIMHIDRKYSGHCQSVSGASPD